MKKLYIFLLLLLIPTVLLAQYNVDGRRIWPATIDSTKFTSDRSKAIGPGVIGGVQMYDATFGEMWIPVDWDSGGAVATTIRGSGAWSISNYASNQPICGYFPAGASGNFPMKVFGLEADGSGTNDTVAVRFTCPANYKDDTMELYLYWFQLDDNSAKNDTVSFDGTVQAVGGAPIDTATSIFAGGTAMTLVPIPMSYTGPGSDATPDSLLFITNLDPEVEELDSGDLITVYLWCDVSRSHLDTGEEVYLMGILVRWDIADTP